MIFADYRKGIPRRELHDWPQEQIAFPEVTADLADRFYGLEATIVTTAKIKKPVFFLQAMGMLFRDK